jgi:hypothetical protein
MRKEIICYVTTNEEGEEVAVQRVSDDPQFVLVRVGQIRLVLNKHELVHAIETCDMYGKAFDEEQKMAENKAKLDASRAAAASKGFVVEEKVAPAPAKKPKVKQSGSKEEKGTLVMDMDVTRGPTASELELERITKLMNGPSLEVKDRE